MPLAVAACFSLFYSQVLAPAAPAGMPLTLKGRNFAAGGSGAGGPGGNHASFGCSFDGAPAAAGGGHGMSSTLFRCEVRAVAPVIC